MEAVSRGATQAGGLALGFLPGVDRFEGNPYLTIALATGMGELRNAMLIRAADAVIAIGGSWGTMSEVSLAMRTGKPLVAVRPWRISGNLFHSNRRIRVVRSARQATDIASMASSAATRAAPSLPGHSRSDPVDVWRAYELAQKHYESDLQLFSTRMNLFLLVQSALVALTATLASQNVKEFDAKTVSAFGLLLASGWFVVAASSYVWIHTWRLQMIKLGLAAQEETGVSTSSAAFDRHTRRDLHIGSRAAKLPEVISWYVRPTLISCLLPLLFIAGWIYIGWLRL